MFVLAMTSTLNRLTSKSNQFISVPKCTKSVKLVKTVKFPKCFMKYHAKNFLGTNAQTDNHKT